MSAESFVAFFGVRFEVDDSEIDSLEVRTHKLMLAAKRSKLDTYWGKLRNDSESYSLLVGKRLGVLGAENDAELNIDIKTLLVVHDQVREQLQKAEINEAPSLLMIWQPD